MFLSSGFSSIAPEKEYLASTGSMSTTLVSSMANSAYPWRGPCRGSRLRAPGSASGFRSWGLRIRLRGPTVDLGPVEDVAGDSSSVLGSAPKAVGELRVPQDG